MRALNHTMVRVAVACLGVIGPAAAPLAAAPGPTTSFNLSSLTPNAATRVRANLCWSNAPAKTVVVLERQLVGASGWTSVERAPIQRRQGCVGASVPVGSMGHYRYRSEVVRGARALRVSVSRDLYAYGVISANALFYAQFGCGDNMATVSDGVHSYQYFCQLSAGRTSAQASEAVFRSNTSCRAMTLRLVGTDNPPGDIGDTSIDSMNLTQSTLSPQPISFNANTPTSVTFRLDGSPATIQTWNNRGDFNESVYVLSAGSTASCWTSSGVAAG